MIKVNYRALGMLSTNCYVVENPDSQKVLIVDPGDSPLEIERQIDEIDGDPEAILLTHGHFDHMLATDALRKKYHIPVYVHEKEQHLLGDPKENLSGLWSKPYTMQADKNVKESATIFRQRKHFFPVIRCSASPTEDTTSRHPPAES